MDRNDNFKLLLILILVWLAIIPILELLLLADPKWVVQEFARAGLTLPYLSKLLLPYITIGRIIILAVAVSVLIIFIHVRSKDVQRRSVMKLSLLVLWHVPLLLILFAVVLPNYKVGVPDQPKLSNSQIQK